MSWQATVLTLFPEMFPGPLGASMPGRALESAIWSLETLDIREFAYNKHRSVDDTPFGGGCGMVMRSDVVAGAIEAAAATGAPDRPVIYMSPRGRVFDQAMARDWASGPGVILLCGRYEGIDERVLEACAVQEVSAGDFVLSGGEPAALCLLDAAVRLLPGVLGDPGSLEEESFAAGLLEYPQYTRPQVWRERAVPEVLVSGHHEKIRKWRQERAEHLTAERRPDLWEAYVRAGRQQT